MTKDMLLLIDKMVDHGHHTFEQKAKVVPPFVQKTLQLLPRKDFGHPLELTAYLHETTYFICHSSLSRKTV
jgi:hypothetical protein